MEGEGGGDDSESVWADKGVGADENIKNEPERLIDKSKFANVLFFFGQNRNTKDKSAGDGDEVNRGSVCGDADSDSCECVETDDKSGDWFFAAFEKVINKYFDYGEEGNIGSGKRAEENHAERGEEIEAKECGENWATFFELHGTDARNHS